MESKLKTFRSELKLNAAQMKSTGEYLEGLKNKQSILKNELTASREKIVLLNQKLEEAKRIFGENAIETQTYERELARAKTQQIAIQSEIAETNTKIKEQEKANSSLSQSIEKSSSEIEKLDRELELNATKLQGASDKTTLLKERQTLLGNQSQSSADKVKALEKALEECGREAGENSDEYSKLSAELMEAKIQQAAIQNEIKETTKELKEQKTSLQMAGETIGAFEDGAGRTKASRSEYGRRRNACSSRSIGGNVRICICRSYENDG